MPEAPQMQALAERIAAFARGVQHDPQPIDDFALTDHVRERLRPELFIGPRVFVVTRVVTRVVAGRSDARRPPPSPIAAVVASNHGLADHP